MLISHSRWRTNKENNKYDDNSFNPYLQSGGDYKASGIHCKSKL